MTDMTWHADAATPDELPRRWPQRGLRLLGGGASVACERCRLALAMTATDRDSARAADIPEHESMHEHTWARVLDEVDRPSSDPVLGLLVRWWPEHELRPILAAPCCARPGASPACCSWRSPRWSPICARSRLDPLSGRARRSCRWSEWRWPTRIPTSCAARLPMRFPTGGSDSCWPGQRRFWG